MTDHLQSEQSLSQAASDRLRWRLWLLEQEQDETMGELVHEDAPPDPNT